LSLRLPLFDGEPVASDLDHVALRTIQVISHQTLHPTLRYTLLDHKMLLMVRASRMFQHPRRLFHGS
jgi:hypothetical protein